MKLSYLGRPSILNPEKEVDSRHGKRCSFAPTQEDKNGRSELLGANMQLCASQSQEICLCFLPLQQMDSGMQRWRFFIITSGTLLSLQATARVIVQEPIHTIKLCDILPAPQLYMHSTA